MRSDHRKKPRRPVHYPAWIEAGDAGLVKCMLSDASESGARLTLDAPGKVADAFTLRLSKDGVSSRECRVIWRSDSQVGVEYFAVPKPKIRTVARPKTAKSSR